MQFFNAFNAHKLLAAFRGSEKPKPHNNKILTQIERLGDGYSAQKAELAATALLNCNALSAKDKDAQIPVLLNGLEKAGFLNLGKGFFDKKFIPETVTSTEDRKTYRMIGVAMGELQEGALHETSKAVLRDIVKPQSLGTTVRHELAP